MNLTARLFSYQGPDIGWQNKLDKSNLNIQELTPTREQITLWEKVVLEWLPLLNSEERNLVWKRANRIPWKLLSREFNVSRQILTLRLNKALHKIGYTFWANSQKCFYVLLRNPLDFSSIIIYNIDIRKHKLGGKTCLD